MTSKDLKVAYLRDTGKQMYNHDIRPVEELLEYIDWLEEKIIDFDKYMKLVREVDKNTNEALSALERHAKGLDE
jgi:hypothetical protein